MKTIDLRGNWLLLGKSPEGKGIACQLTIPGDFHSALLKEGIIKDPYMGFNEKDQLWVGQSQWTIEREFEYQPFNGRSFLTITEADTFFTVYINDKKVASGQNQFARYRFDVSDYLLSGNNKITIVFDSAEKKSVEISKKLPYPVPYMKYDIFSPDRNLARKCQCHGGWDWGPCIMVSGIYGDIKLECVEDGLFNYVNVNYEHENDNWIAKILVNFYSIVEKSVHFDFEIAGPDIKNATLTKEYHLNKGENLISVDLEVKSPSLWKSAGELEEACLSQNTIYTLTVKENDVSEIRKIAFNTLKAVSKKDKINGKDGRSIYFENNGKRIFAKGSNWIPAENLPSRLTDQRYKDLIESAVKAHHNFIRVWGGGFYEKEIFYDLCDLYGIIIWQDFMFACSMYPASEEFLSEVQNELDYQIPRLQSHACIGLWCGNNENYGAMNWFEECHQNHDRYMVDYDRLYHDTIGKAVKKYDNRLYWQSSPCAGPDDFADNWHADTMGDMHYWSVWHERKSFDAYLSIRPRFVSEFGYESFPSMECIRSFADEKDLNFTSKLMEYHQRSPSGNSIIIENFSRYFKFPLGFENMVYLSQVQQALAIKTAVDWWRSLAPSCMGAVIWQLNDIWPGPSWSMLEYNGKWKLLQYLSARFFAPLYVSAFIKDKLLYVKACNDNSRDCDINVKVQYLRFDGSQYKAEKNINIKAPSASVTDIFEEALDSENAEDYFIYVSSTINGKTSSEVIFPALYKHAALEKANISMQIKERSCDFEIILTTDKPAFYVSLDNDNLPGLFSDNMITLLAGKEEKLIFTPKAGTKPSLEDVKKKISVKNLSGSY
ncbi:MAG: glycoside hydrolase family 2 protein [Treponema sp.]|nr:glycoside hydrolase family 2 protein [Treponema sp.]